MKKLSRNQLLNILFTLATIFVNVLANALPLNGKNTGEISDQFSIYFVPAGYVFSIWGVIYLGLIFFVVFQALGNQKEEDWLRDISPYYWIASISNMAWIFLWHYEIFEFTLIAMVSLLVSLIMIYKGISGVNFNQMGRVAVSLTFSIYLGWVSVATIANASQVLYFLGWDGGLFLPQTWAVIMLWVATALGVWMLISEQDVAFVLVLVWAFAGIAFKFEGISMVSLSAWQANMVLSLGALIVTSRKILKGD